MLELAQDAAADQFDQADMDVDRAILGSGLKDAAGLLHDVAEDAALGHGQRQRLFADHVLAGLGRHDSGNHVPMVGRGDAHRVDVLAADQFAEVAVGRAALVVLAQRRTVMAVDVGFGGVEMILVDVADRDDLGVGTAVDLGEVPAAAVIPAADVTVGDAIARGGGSP